MRRALAVAVVAACGSSEPLVAPVVESPPASSAANPYADIDGLDMSVAHAGDAADVDKVTVARDQIPELSSIPFAEDLVVHLSGRRGNVEVAYGRTCRFAVRRDATPPAPHLYFSRIVRWASGPEPPRRASGMQGYATPGGDAVLVGGSDGGVPVGDIQRFEPALGTFVSLDPVVSAPRDGAVLAPLPDGEALRVGGLASPGEGVDFFELINPAAAPALQVQTINDPRLRLVEHAVATLVDGSVVVLGGRLQDGGPFAISGAAWSIRLGDAGLPDRPRLLAARLARPRGRHTLTRLGDDVFAVVLVVGGKDDAGPVDVAELYEPLREAFAVFGPSMVTPRYDHAAVRLPDGSVLILGGRDAGGAAVAALELFLPHLGQFRAVGTMPPGAGLVDVSVASLPDGRVLVAGGRDAGGSPVRTTYIARLDPIDGTVEISQTDDLAAARAGAAAVRLCDGTVLLVGGTGDPQAPGSERYNPPSAGRR